VEIENDLIPTETAGFQRCLHQDDDITNMKTFLPEIEFAPQEQPRTIPASQTSEIDVLMIYPSPETEGNVKWRKVRDAKQLLEVSNCYHAIARRVLQIVSR